MSKGLPWVGAGGPPPVPRDQYAPPPGTHFNESDPVEQTKHESNQHESLNKDWPAAAYSKPRLMR